MNFVDDPDEFVDHELRKNNLQIIAVTEEIIIKRLAGIKNFINSIMNEYSTKYPGWTEKNDEYFLKPMDRKFSYSYMIVDEKDEILNMTFNSIYGDRMHIHCMFTRDDFRKKGLTKLSVIKACQKGIDDGFETIGGFWPKNNNGSLVLFLRLGWTIEYMRNDVELFLKGNLREIVKNAMRLYIKENQL